MFEHIVPSWGVIWNVIDLLGGGALLEEVALGAEGLQPGFIFCSLPASPVQIQCEHTACLRRLHASPPGQDCKTGKAFLMYSALVRVLSQQQDVGRAGAGGN